VQSYATFNESSCCVIVLVIAITLHTLELDGCLANFLLVCNCKGSKLCDDAKILESTSKVLSLIRLSYIKSRTGGVAYLILFIREVHLQKEKLNNIRREEIA
jgi:hypothetical protein